MYTEQDLTCPATVTFLQWRFLIAEGIIFVLAMFVVWWWRGWWDNFWPLVMGRFHKGQA